MIVVAPSCHRWGWSTGQHDRWLSYHVKRWGIGVTFCSEMLLKGVIDVGCGFLSFVDPVSMIIVDVGHLSSVVDAEARAPLMAMHPFEGCLEPTSRWMLDVFDAKHLTRLCWVGLFLWRSPNRDQEKPHSTDNMVYHESSKIWISPLRCVSG